jgi:hypothetical protein
MKKKSMKSGMRHREEKKEKKLEGDVGKGTYGKGMNKKKMSKSKMY